MQSLYVATAVMSALACNGCEQQEDATGPIAGATKKTNVEIKSLDGSKRVEVCFPAYISNAQIDDRELIFTFADATKLPGRSVAKPGKELRATVFVFSNEAEKHRSVAFASQSSRRIALGEFVAFIPDGGLQILATQDKGLIGVRFFPARADASEEAVTKQLNSFIAFVEESIAACTFTRAPPVPPRMHALVKSVDLPPSYSGRTRAYAVVRAVEEDGKRWTLYIPYYDPAVPRFRLAIPKPRQRCTFDIAPGFADQSVGHEVWAKERQVTFMINADCKGG